jgi:hypothetical protein
VSGATALSLLSEWVLAQADYRQLSASNAPDDERGQAALRFLELDGKLRALNGKDVARWASDLTQKALTAPSPLVEMEARALAAEKERDVAVQILINTIQAQGGDVAQDWSSWRVGFGRGVYRGYGQTDAQQIVSATAQALGRPDCYAPKDDAQAGAQHGAGGER